jgi:hypothetical protein
MEHCENRDGNFWDDWGEGKDHVEAILHSVDEEHPELKERWIGTLEVKIFSVLVFALKLEDILLILWNETWDLSGSEHTVDGLKEGLGLDLSIGHDEGNLLTEWTSLSVQVLDIILQVVVVVSLGQRNLEEDLLANVGGKLGKGLFSGTTHSDQEAVATWGIDDSGDLQ